jgi:hypothetical protein
MSIDVKFLQTIFYRITTAQKRIIREIKDDEIARGGILLGKRKK